MKLYIIQKWKSNTEEAILMHFEHSQECQRFIDNHLQDDSFKFFILDEWIKYNDLQKYRVTYLSRENTNIEVKTK